MTEKLPKESESQRIGQVAKVALDASRPLSWRPEATDSDSDVGLDFTVQVVADGRYCALFHLQLKGSEQAREDGRSKWTDRAGTKFSQSLKISTLEYFRRIQSPVLIAFADLARDSDPRKCPVYFVWLHEAMDAQIGEDGTLPAGQSEFSVHIPVANLLDDRTDLLPDLEEYAQNRQWGLRLFSAIERHVEHAPTSMPKIYSRLAESKVAVESLQLDIDHPWLEAPKDSFAGRLKESHDSLAVGDDDQCLKILEELAPKIEGVTEHQQGEYWYLFGRALAFAGDYAGATNPLLQAKEKYPKIVRYHVGYWENRFYSSDCSPDSAERILAKIEVHEEAPYRPLRSKLLSVLGRHEEALEQLLAEETESPSLGRALAFLIAEEMEKTIAECDVGLAQESLSRRGELSLRVIKARALFGLGFPSWSTQEWIPFVGVADMRPKLLREAWGEIAAAWPLARRLNFPGEIELLFDISGTVGCYLDEIDRVYSYMKEAAFKRPSRGLVQKALLDLAMHQRDITTALAQLTFVESEAQRAAYQVVISYFRNQLREAVKWALRHRAEILREKGRNHRFALMVACICAAEAMDGSARETLEEDLRELDQTGDLLAAYEAAADTSLGRLSRAEAVDRQFGKFQEGSLGPECRAQLFDNLWPSHETEARRLLKVLPEILARRPLTWAEWLRVGQAIGTCARWEDLLSHCSSAEVRFGRRSKLLTFQAWALVELGDTPKALELLGEVTSRPEQERGALDLYSQIAASSGLLKVALEGYARLFEQATDREEKAKSLWALLCLEFSADPTSSRIPDLWWKYGTLCDQSDEGEEGQFLAFFWRMRVAHEGTLKEDWQEEHRRRFKAFIETFPESRIIQRVEISESPSMDELIEALDRFTGSSPDVRARLSGLEEMLANGRIALPFVLRPELLSCAADLYQLFDLCLSSRKSARAFQLRVGGGRTGPGELRDLLSSMLFIDEISLLVLGELELLDDLFSVFGKVLVGREVFSRIQHLAHSEFRRPGHARVERLASRLTQNVRRVHQVPLVRGAKGTPSQFEEIRALREFLSREDVQFVCDDLDLRTWILRDPESERGLVLSDLLEVFRQEGVLSSKEVAEKMGEFCSWNVSGVRLRFLGVARLLEGRVGIDEPVRSIRETIEGDDRVSGYLEVLWGAADYKRRLAVLIGLLTPLVVEESTEESVTGRLEIESNLVATLWALWFWRCLDLSESGKSGGDFCVESMAHLASSCVRRLSPDLNDRDIARRLWGIFDRFLESIYSQEMSQALSQRLVADLGAWLGEHAGGLRDGVCQFLLGGLVDGSRERRLFHEAYLDARARAS